MNASPKKKIAMLYVGTDIGKNNLDAFAARRVYRVKNNPAGWEELLVETRKQSRYLHFVCEPSGWIGEAFIQFLHRRRKRVSLIPPFRARQFAEATGRMAKNDRVDARMLADLGEKLKPKPSIQLRKAERDLQAAMRCRRFLFRTQKALERKLQTMEKAQTRQSFIAVIESIKEQLGTIDAFSDGIVSRDKLLRGKHNAFLVVSGIASLTAKNLLGEFPEVGRVNRRETAALAGLAPFDNESGIRIGKRRPWGGRTDLRAMIYMPAVVALTHNPVLRPFYKRLIKRGKLPRVAVVAVMRKLLIYLNSIARKVERGEPTPLLDFGPITVNAKRIKIAQSAAMQKKRRVARMSL